MIIAWLLNVGVNSYDCHEGYDIGTGIRVLTLNVLSTTDDFMSVDRKAFKTAVWEALDGTKNQLCFSKDKYMDWKPQ